MSQYAVVTEGVVETIVSATAETAEAAWVLIPNEIIDAQGTNIAVSPGDLYDASTETFSKRQSTAEENEVEAKTLLENSDWTQLSDVNLTDASREAFATYRAALRAVAVAPSSGDVSWPTKPTPEYT